MGPPQGCCMEWVCVQECSELRSWVQRESEGDRVGEGRGAALRGKSHTVCQSHTWPYAKRLPVTTYKGIRLFAKAAYKSVCLFVLHQGPHP